MSKGNRTIKHGMSRHPLYRVWIGIKDRLYRSNNAAYKWYGGDGVVMCEEWLNSPAAFIKWALDNGWQKGMHIDKDKKAFELGVDAKIYSPQMCSVLTAKVNNRHAKYNRYIEYNGNRQTFIDWCADLGIDQTTLWHRFNKGMTVEDAFLKPVDKNKSRYANSCR